MLIQFKPIILINIYSYYYWLISKSVTSSTLKCMLKWNPESSCLYCMLTLILLAYSLWNCLWAHALHSFRSQYRGENFHVLHVYTTKVIDQIRLSAASTLGIVSQVCHVSQTITSYKYLLFVKSCLHDYNKWWLKMGILTVEIP